MRSQDSNSHRLKISIVILCCITSFVSFATAQENDSETFPDADLEFFESKVRPILVERCYDCHGPDSGLEGELSLASREDLLHGGETGPAVVPKSADESLLIESVHYAGVYEMPPDSKLPQKEIDVLTKWVNLGAPWPAESNVATNTKKAFDLETRKAEHWCWHPRKNPSPPEIDDDDWSQQPLDKFVVRQLRVQQLTPNESTDKRTLIRRLHFDVTGLPPTPEQVQSFINDDSPNAFEKVVDAALASPRFGEHWARHWMDLTRYAETGGHEFDYPFPDAWQYRDYLIRAFNEDVPYDQLIREHIAGDLIESPRRHQTQNYNESILGTGFWFLHEAVHGPTDGRADRADHVDNQIDVMSKTFLGLTVACARCHDHKFDAISAEDYYALFGYLKSSRRQQAMLDVGRKIESAAQQCESALANIRKSEEEIFEWLSKSDRDSLANHLATTIEFIQSNPNWNNTSAVTFATDQLPKHESTGGKTEIQTLKGQQGFKWNDDTQFWWRNAKVGDKLSFDFDEEKFSDMAGQELELFVGYTTARDYGIVRIRFNDEVVCEELDCYSKSLQTPGRTSLGKIKIKAGINRLEFEILAPNPKAIARNMIGIDFLEFVSQVDQREELDANLKLFVSEADHFDAEELKTEFLSSLAGAVSQPTTQDESHPLNGFYKMSCDKNWYQSAKAKQKKRIARKARKAGKDKTKLFADFRNGIPADWFITGSAMINQRTDGRDENRENELSEKEIHNGYVESDLLGGKFCGVLRSPTFTIEHEKVFYRIKGKSCQVRLIIDGFVMDVYNALLYKGCAFDLNSNQMKWVVQSGDLKNYLGREAHIEIIDHSDGSFAIEEIRFGSGAPPLNPVTPFDLLCEKAKPKTTTKACLKLLSDCFDGNSKIDLTRNQRRDIVDFFDDHQLIQHLPQPVALNDQLHPIDKLRENKNKLAAVNQNVPKPMFAIAMADGNGIDEHIYIRGNHKTLGKVAKRNFLTALSPQPLKIPTGSGRLELANEISSPENPLTARVAVNRIWHHMIGVGIVPSVDNFGALGQTPTHPELLDFLGNEFVGNQWSVKKMIRRIALSKTYQLSSNSNSTNSETDPNNIYLHRAHVKRLTGESIRDSILAISGQLNEERFGPPVKIHLDSFMQGRGRPGQSGPLDGDGRRSIYIEVRRNFLSPMLLAFDTPAPFNTLGRRNKSNVPAQALILMNSPFVLEQAERWAEKITETSIDDEDFWDEEEVRQMYLEIFSRPVTESELKNAIEFLKAQTKEADAQTAWRDLCHVLFNTKEFIYLK
jgi:hypothetical protein